MFERIVMATDLSPACDEIVARAAEFRTFGCCKAILTHVIMVKLLESLFNETLLGGVAYTVAGLARSPVLLIPRDRF